MRLRERVMELLRAGGGQELAQLVVRDPRTVRLLVGRLWDPDPEMRGRAAEGIGVAAEAHPDLVLEVARNLMWALNDESATNGRWGIAALAEIGAHNPDLIQPFVGPMASLLWDDGVRAELLRALDRIAAVRPDLLRPHCDLIEPYLDDDAPASLGDRLGDDIS